MTSPFVDRVEYQVIGRDVNASGVFRDVADAADSAGNSVTGLGNDLDRVNRSIDDTANRMRELVSSLEDLSATRQITVTTNVSEVLGSVEDNRQVLDLLNNRFENLTIRVTATVNQIVDLNDGLTTINDNRTAIITLGDNVLQLTQNVNATVDGVVNLNDGLQTINDNRTAVITLGDDVRTLTQTIDATVDSVVSLNDGIQTIDDNRTAVITLGDDVRSLTQNIDATVDSVVHLNDGITTIDDNRNVIVTVDDDFRTLTQTIDATVNKVVNLRDGITTVDDNRGAIITVDDDFRTLTQSVDATVNRVVDLRNGITTVDDNRAAITNIGDDFRGVNDDINNTRTTIDQLNRDVDTIGDHRPAIGNIGDGFDDLTTRIQNSRNRVGDLDRDIRNLPAPGGREGDDRIHRTVVETVKSNRDRFEEAGVIAGAAVAHGLLVALGTSIANGLHDIPIVGPIQDALVKIVEVGGPLGVAIDAFLVTLAAAGGVIVANAFTGGVLLALGGGVIAAAIFSAFAIPEVKKQFADTGRSIMGTLRGAVLDSGLVHPQGGGILIDTVKQFGEQFTKLRPLIASVFEGVGPLLKPLMDSMLGFIREMLPGIALAMKDLKPLFDQLAVHGPKLGKAFGDFFSKISTVAPQAASAFGLVLGFVEHLVGWIGNLLLALGELEPFAERAFVPFAKIIGWGLDELFSGLADAAIFAADAFKWLREATGGIDDMFKFIAFAVMGLSQAIWDAISPLRDITGWLTRVLGPLSRLPGLGGPAAGSMRDFGDAADTAGSKSEGASGKVQTLTDKLFGVPDADPKVTAHDFASPIVRGITGALTVIDHKTAVPTVVVDDNTQATLNRVKGALDALNGKTVKVYVQGVQTGTTLYHGYSSGGAVFGSGPKGIDSKLAMLAPGEHVLTAREVEAAGGQEAVYALRRSLLGHTGLGGSGVSATPVGRRASGMDNHGFATALRTALSGMTLVIDDRTGRTAQLIARGG